MHVVFLYAVLDPAECFKIDFVLSQGMKSTEGFGFERRRHVMFSHFADVDISWYCEWKPGFIVTQYSVVKFDPCIEAIPEEQQAATVRRSQTKPSSKPVLWSRAQTGE